MASDKVFIMGLLCLSGSCEQLDLGPCVVIAIVALAALEFLDQLAALREQAPRFLSAREEKRAEPELVAQVPRAG